MDRASRPSSFPISPPRARAASATGGATGGASSPPPLDDLDFSFDLDTLAPPGSPASPTSSGALPTRLKRARSPDFTPPDASTPSEPGKRSRPMGVASAASTELGAVRAVIDARLAAAWSASADAVESAVAQLLADLDAVCGLPAADGRRCIAQAWVALIAARYVNSSSVPRLQAIGAKLAAAWAERGTHAPAGFANEVAEVLNSPLVPRHEGTQRGRWVTCTAAVLNGMFDDDPARCHWLDRMMKLAASATEDRATPMQLGSDFWAVVSGLQLCALAPRQARVQNWVAGWPCHDMEASEQQLVFTILMGWLSGSGSLGSTRSGMNETQLSRLASQPDVSLRRVASFLVTLGQLERRAPSYHASLDGTSSRLQAAHAAIRGHFGRPPGVVDAAGLLAGWHAALHGAGGGTSKPLEAFELQGCELVLQAGELKGVTAAAMREAWFAAVTTSGSAASRERLVALGRGALAATRGLRGESPAMPAALAHFATHCRVAPSTLPGPLRSDASPTLCPQRVEAVVEVLMGSDASGPLAATWSRVLLDADGIAGAEAIAEGTDPQLPATWAVLLQAFSRQVRVMCTLDGDLRELLRTLAAPRTAQAFQQRVDMAVEFDAVTRIRRDFFALADLHAPAREWMARRWTALGLATAARAGQREISMPWLMAADHLMAAGAVIFDNASRHRQPPATAMPSAKALLELAQQLARIEGSAPTPLPSDAPYAFPVPANDEEAHRIGVALALGHGGSGMPADIRARWVSEWLQVVQALDGAAHPTHLLSMACGFAVGCGAALPAAGTFITPQQLAGFAHGRADTKDFHAPAVSAISRLLAAPGDQQPLLAGWLEVLVRSLWPIRGVMLQPHGGDPLELLPWDTSVSELLRVATVGVGAALRGEAVTTRVRSTLEALATDDAASVARDVLLKRQLTFMYGLSYGLADAVNTTSWLASMAQALRSEGAACARALARSAVTSFSRVAIDGLPLLLAPQRVARAVAQDALIPAAQRGRLIDDLDFLALQGLRAAALPAGARLSLHRIAEVLDPTTTRVNQHVVNGALLALSLGGPEMPAGDRQAVLRACADQMSRLGAWDGGAQHLTRIAEGFAAGCGSDLRGGPGQAFMVDLAAIMLNRAAPGPPDLAARAGEALLFLRGTEITAHAARHWIDALLGRPGTAPRALGEPAFPATDARAALTASELAGLLWNFFDSVQVAGVLAEDRCPTLVTAATAFDELPIDDGALLDAVWRAVGAPQDAFESGAARLLAVAARLPRRQAGDLLRVAIHVGTLHRPTPDRERFAQPAGSAMPDYLALLEQALAELAARDHGAGRRLTLIYLALRGDRRPFENDERRQSAIGRLASATSPADQARRVAELERDWQGFSDPLAALAALPRDEPPSSHHARAALAAAARAFAVPGVLDSDVVQTLWRRICGLRLPSEIQADAIAAFLGALGPQATSGMFRQARQHIVARVLAACADSAPGRDSQRATDRKAAGPGGAEGPADERLQGQDIAWDVAPFAIVAALYENEMLEARGLGFLRGTGFDPAEAQARGRELFELQAFVRQELQEIGALDAPELLKHTLMGTLARLDSVLAEVLPAARARPALVPLRV